MERVNVKRGYGLNSRVPQGLAVEANDRNLNGMQHHKRQLAHKAEKLGKEAADIKARIEAVECTFVHKASEEGKLFGSIDAGNIADAITAAGAEVTKMEVKLPEGSIRHTGEFELTIQLHTDVTANVTVEVIAE